MNKLSHPFKIALVLLAVTAAWTMALRFPVRAKILEGGNIRIEYPGDGPLWDAHLILPGFKTAPAMTVTNKSSSTRDIGIRGENESGSMKLLQGIELKVYTDDGIVYGSTDGVTNVKHLSDLFLAEDEEITLSEIAGNSSETYYFEVNFGSDAGNEYQGLGAKFDLVVGGLTIPSVLGEGAVLGEETEAVGDILGIATGGNLIYTTSASLAMIFVGLRLRRRATAKVS